jgi:hypothetical protein
VKYLDEEYIAEKYGLVPIYAADPEDGTAIVVVEWDELKKMFTWLEDNYEIGIGRDL